MRESLPLLLIFVFELHVYLGNDALNLPFIFFLNHTNNCMQNAQNGPLGTINHVGLDLEPYSKINYSGKNLISTTILLPHVLLPFHNSSLSKWQFK